MMREHHSLNTCSRLCCGSAPHTPSFVHRIPACRAPIPQPHQVHKLPASLAKAFKFAINCSAPLRFFLPFECLCNFSKQFQRIAAASCLSIQVTLFFASKNSASRYPYSIKPSTEFSTQLQYNKSIQILTYLEPSSSPLTTGTEYRIYNT
jgi:hypothetical protein